MRCLVQTRTRASQGPGQPGGGGFFAIHRRVGGGRDNLRTGTSRLCLQYEPEPTSTAAGIAKRYKEHMKTIGLRELRQHASKVLRLAENGETFQVTDRGRPLALIVPLRNGDALEALRAAGETSTPKGRVTDLPDPIEIPRGATRPSKVLTRLRADER